MSNFEDLKKSLEEAIAYKQGKLENVKKHRREIVQDPENLENPTNSESQISRKHRLQRP